MKTKYLKYSLSALVAITIGFTGCVDDTIQSVIDDNTDNPSDSVQIDDGNNNTPNIDDSAYPAIPNYPNGANSIGMIEVNCQDDIIYYTLSYVCFRTTVKLSTKTTSGTLTEDEDAKQGTNPFTYYESGHITRDGKVDAVEVTGTITGGNGGGPYTARCAQVN